ncbi:MAG: sodium:solute symporter family protein [Hydrogenophaga sp.]|uniref:sodium:solute symporter family protein n=1 Tax=Hydrogenophaga sp. TaxID=1904254 RepID=UPI003D9B6862
MSTPGESRSGGRAFKRQLDRVYTWYAGGFFVFVLLLAGLEQLGVPRTWIGFIFLLSTILLYAVIGIMSRTTDATEYYVAGRRVPAVYNGMATGADWMSAASFIGLAGTLYLSGYNGLAFIMGWTGGYCLVALLLAPYLRKFGQFTIPDFLGERYGGNWPRLLGIAAAILCSFTYVVAQIYGVGLITSHLTGVAFELGVFLGLGGILVCSFLGGMRAVTWTQVAQYIILIVAYLIPVVWLSVKQTGAPVPQLIYGFQLEKVTAKEKLLTHDPKELEVRELFRQRAETLTKKLQDPAAALVADKAAAEAHLSALRQANATSAAISAAEKTLSALPRDSASARITWTRERDAAELKSRPLNGMAPHAQQYLGDPHGDAPARQAFDASRRNFLALVFCLMVGTAALPHILMRYYTTPSVREARQSVTWSLFFIFLLYVTAPALAVLVKYEVFHTVVGTPLDRLPQWVASWNQVDASLMSITDINLDGILQLNEITIGGDIVVLATPEIGGLPYVVSALVAAGGLAAALSTADGLLLTIANALSHDLYYKMIDPNASTARRVTISKVLLLVVALAAAYVAAQKPADILFLVSAAFSFAAAAFFPALVLGIFWKRTTGVAAALGMIAGLGVTSYYMVVTQPWLREVFGITSPVHLWWDILPISAGVFGVPVGFAVTILVSLVTPPPSAKAQELVEYVRYPHRHNG